MINIDDLALRLKAAAERAGAGEWQYIRTSAVSNSYIVNGVGRTVVNVTTGDVPARYARFIELTNPANILTLLAERDADKKQLDAMSQAFMNLKLLADVYLHAYEEAKASVTALEARTVSVNWPDGWHFEECETEGCQNGAIFSVGKAANNLHLCEACTKAHGNGRFTKTALPKRLPFNLGAGINLEVEE